MRRLSAASVLHNVEMAETHDPAENIAAIAILKLPKRYPNDEIITRFTALEGLVFIEEL